MSDDKHKRADKIYRSQRAEVDKREDTKDFLLDKSVGGGPKMMRPSDDYIEKSLGKQKGVMERHHAATAKTNKQVVQEERTEARQSEVKKSIDLHRRSLGLEPNKEQPVQQKPEQARPEKQQSKPSRSVDSQFNTQTRDGQAEKQFIRDTFNKPPEKTEPPRDAFADKSREGQQEKEAVRSITAKVQQNQTSNDNAKDVGNDDKTDADKQRRMERARAMMARREQEKSKSERER